MVPESILSCLIYSTRCEYIILKVCKNNWSEPTRLVGQTFVWDKWAEKLLDFARFSTCVPLWLAQE